MTSQSRPVRKPLGFTAYLSTEEWSALTSEAKALNIAQSTYFSKLLQEKARQIIERNGLDSQSPAD